MVLKKYITVFIIGLLCWLLGLLVKMAWNMRKLCTEVLTDTSTCFKWLQEQGLVPQNPLCSICGSVMKIRVRGDNQILFRCQKNSETYTHNNTKNALVNTFFEHSKFGLNNIVVLMYYFSLNNISYDFLIRECSWNGLITSRQTISDWLSFCRQVCLVWIDDQFEREILLGGPGIIVGIDECKIGLTKRKYNQGRPGEGTWILGLIEINTNVKGREKRGGRFRIEICPDNKRDADTLIPLIIKHIQSGTTVVTDLWGPYFGLADHGNHYFTVNRNTNVLDPLTSVDAQNIELSWLAIKKNLFTGITKNNIENDMCEYLYRREVSLSGEDPFNHFIKAVKHAHPGD